MRFFSFILLFFIGMCLGNTVYAKSKQATISLDFQQVNLPDAVRILSKFMHRNVIVSPHVVGSVSLQLQDALPNDVFHLILTSQGLTTLRMGNILYVAPQAEVVSRKEEDAKIQDSIDDSTNLSTQIWQIRYAKADDIGHLLQDGSASLLSKRGHVRVDVRTNKICIQDIAKNFPAIAALIQKLDVPVQQVLIEARLASVDNDFERELGVSFTSQMPHAHERLRDVVAPMQQGTRFSLAVATLADGSLLDVLLAAMENDGRGELISSPSLFTANQQTASIESGEEIPYQEVSPSGGTGVTFKKAVLSLKVTPQVLPGNKVLLQLQVNQDRPSSRIVLGVPAISTRQMTTSILVKNGQTLVLGGIYELNKEHSEQRIPFLGKIPLVGLLFQQQNAKENKRELLIFVTPKIIS